MENVLVYIIVGLLLLLLYGVIGWALEIIADDNFTNSKINVSDYAIGFIILWPLVIVVLILFGLVQVCRFAHDLLTSTKK